MDVDAELLERLIEDRRIDEVFELVSIDEAARAWCEYQTHEHHGDEGDDPLWWAIALMFRLRDLNDPRERQMLTLVIEHAPDEDVLGVAGAGPLEDLLGETGNDEECLAWIEAQAAASAKFRKALANVWVRGDVRPDTFARLERAARVPLR